MKMSDVFQNLPIDITRPLHEYTNINNALDGSTLPYAAHAINNHDALAQALDSLIDVHDAYDYDGHCNSCGCTKHSDNCDYIAAIKLLAKIKGESDE